jgi:hypothetical protein
MGDTGVFHGALATAPSELAILSPVGAMCTIRSGAVFD